MRTTRTAALPPFYTQPIGSLPRPKVVLDLLGRRDQAAMDDAVRFAIRLQEKAGLDVVSDGEWRRTQYIREFLDRVGGFERCRRFEHQGETKFTEVVVRRMARRRAGLRRGRPFPGGAHRPRHEVRPAQPVPDRRSATGTRTTAATPTRRYQHFLEHLAEILAREAQALVEAGIDIVQIDDPALTYFCDRELMAGGKARTTSACGATGTSGAAVPRGAGGDQPRRRGAEGRGPPALLPQRLQAAERRARRLQAAAAVPRIAKGDRVNLEFAYQGTGDVSDLHCCPRIWAWAWAWWTCAARRCRVSRRLRHSRQREAQIVGRSGSPSTPTVDCSELGGAADDRRGL